MDAGQNTNDKRDPARSDQTSEEPDKRQMKRGIAKELLTQAIHSDVFPEATRRLKDGTRNKEINELFSPLIMDRAKRTLYFGKDKTNFDLLAWLQSLNTDVAMKIEFLQILARALGDDWCEDSRSFIDVTIAISRLQVILRNLGQLELASIEPGRLGNAIVVVPPGEAHQFGQCIVEELFSTRGWATELFVPENNEQLIDHILRGDHDIVCMSWSSSSLVDVVKAAIAAIETIEPSHRPAIIAGGSASLNNGKWLVSQGVDHICDSAYAAMNIAEEMLVENRREDLERT